MAITTIHVPDDVLEKGKTAAREDGRSFSRHVARLIERDLTTKPHANQSTRSGNRKRPNQLSP